MEKSGFTLEVDVFNYLMQKNWTVYPQCAYIDQETGKIRTIDMIAHPIELYKEDIPRLIIECKFSRNRSWVFFVPPVVSSQEKNLSINMTILSAGIGMEFSLCKANPVFKAEKDFGNKLRIASEIMGKTHFRKVPLAHSCHVVGMNQGEDRINDFRKAILQLNGAYKAKTKPEYESPSYLCIVFRGELFVLDANKKLTTADHIAFANLNEENTKQILPPFVDVVRDSYFANYLNIIRNDMSICIGADLT